MVAAALVVGFGAVMSAAPALAHSETGSMVVEVRGPSPDQVEVRARVTYANDGDPAPGAAVEATLTGPAGESRPLTLQDNGDGTYQATTTVDQPGQWTARLTSTTPAATAEATFSVAPSETTTTVGTAATTTSRADGTASAASSDDEEDGDDAAPWIVLGVVVVVLAAAAGALAWSRRARRARRV
jgi:hypothetical protein